VCLPGAPLERRRRRAVRTLERALARARNPAEQLAALNEYLAARTRERAEAWNGRDFARWAAERAPALPERVVHETSEAMAGLEAAVWGGASAPDGERLRALARSLAEAGL
jgi:hypothetical protein